METGGMGDDDRELSFSLPIFGAHYVPPTDDEVHEFYERLPIRVINHWWELPPIPGTHEMDGEFDSERYEAELAAWRLIAERRDSTSGSPTG